MIELVFIALAVILFIFFLKISMRHKYPMRAAFFNMVLGTAALIISSLMLKSFGIVLAINIFTVFLALTLGIPGAGLLVLYLLV